MSAQPRSAAWAWIAALWGIGGVVVLLANAIARLTPWALEPLREGSMGFWVALGYLGSVVFMVYSEGYYGFHLRFAPRVVGRAMHLGRHPNLLWLALAPLYCMALVGAARRKLVAQWILIAAIVTMVVLVKFVPQPWRGIIDAGVVAGLLFGVLSILVFAWRGWRTGELPDVPLSLPGGRGASPDPE